MAYSYMRGKNWNFSDNQASLKILDLCFGVKMIEWIKKKVVWI